MITRHTVYADGHPIALWEKSPSEAQGAIVLLHGRTWSARPNYDLQVAGEDLSLMDGLVEDPAAGLVFDKPEGRIVEAHAAGAVGLSEVRAFYGAPLGQLGWRRDDDGVYQRDDESLRITLGGVDGAATVQFSLSPN